MLNFMCKPNSDTLAVSPKFYDTNGGIINLCRRFFTIWDYIPSFSGFIRKKHLEHSMHERGDMCYYSIHRIDFASLDCLLIFSKALRASGGIPSIGAEKYRDAFLSKSISIKAKGKVMFFPHSRVILSEVSRSTKSGGILSFLRYFTRYGIRFW